MSEPFQNERINQLNSEVQILREENEQLLQQLTKAQLHESEPKKKKRSYWLGRLGSGIILGRRLKKSLLRLFNEIPEKRVSKDTLAEVTAHVIWRLTRIGILGLTIALIPAAILIMQTLLLSKQNNLLEEQNRVVQSHSNLMEAQNSLIESQLMETKKTDKKSQYNLLLTSLKGQINSNLKGRSGRFEKSKEDNVIRNIANGVVQMEAYKETDSLTVSPEKGQLLSFLVNKELDTDKTYPKIFSKVQFDNADLERLKLDGVYLSGVSLNGSNLKGINLENSNLESASLKGAYLAKANLKNSNLKKINLSGAIAIDANFLNVDLEEAILTYANLTGADLRDANLTNANLTNAKLDNVLVDAEDWLDQLNSIGITGLRDLTSRYEVDGQKRKDSNRNTYYMVVSK